MQHINPPSNDRERAAQRHLSLSRRAFLRGVGGCVARPALESLRPPEVLGAVGIPQAAGSTPRAPVRMAFMEFPNGALPRYWWPTGEPGRDFELNRTLRPLEPVKSKIQILSG